MPPKLKRICNRTHKRWQRAKRAEVVAKSAFAPTQTNGLKGNVNTKTSKSFRQRLGVRQIRFAYRGNAA